MPGPPELLGRVCAVADNRPAAARRRRRSVRLTARAVPRSRSRVRRDLPDPAVRHRPHLGGSLHAARRPGAQGRHPPATGRDDQHERRHVDAPAAGRALGRRGVRPAPARGARQPRLCGRVRGHVPAPQRPPAAPADPRHPRRPPPDLDDDDGARPRCAPAARARRHPRIAVRDSGDAEPSLPRARSGPARLRVVEQAAAGRLQRALVRGHHARADGPARRSLGARRRQLAGRPDRDRDGPQCARADRRAWSALPRGRMGAPLASPARSRAAPRARDAAARHPPLADLDAVLEHVPRPGRDRSGGRSTSSSTSSAASTTAPARGMRSGPPPATSTSRRRSGVTASIRGSPI